MHENGRLYFEGNAGENAPANMKNAPAAIKTGVPAAAGLPGPQERKHSLGRWTLGRIAPFSRCLISCIYHQCFRRYRCARPKRINRPKPPGKHVQDAPYNTGCDLTVPQSLGTVNQIQKETSAAARAGPLRLCLQTSRMARDVRADGAGLHFAVVDGERAAQIDL